MLAALPTVADLRRRVAMRHQYVRIRCKGIGQLAAEKSLTLKLGHRQDWTCRVVQYVAANAAPENLI